MSLTVLVADDSKLSRRSVIRAMPSELDTSVLEATNGREAIELLTRNDIQLVLLDLTMPDIDGVGVLKYLSQQSSPPNVIVISADYQPEKQRTVMSLGAKRFLRKPLDTEELAMTLFELGYL